MTHNLRFAPYALAFAALLLLLTALSGCDAFGLGGTTWTGLVVDAETGEPIEDMQVSLKVGAGGFGGYRVVESAFTDREGAFRLHTSRSDTILFANSPELGDDESYRRDYSSSGPLIYTGSSIRIELTRR